MEIKIDEKAVVITAKDKWTYDGVVSDKLQTIAPELFSRIQKEVEYSLDNKEKIEEEKRLQEKKAKFEANWQRFNAFKSRVELHLKFKKFDIAKVNIRIPNINDNYIWEPDMNFGMSVDVSYDDRVYHRGAWSSSKTNSPWKVSANYKITRYSTLEKAIDKAIEKFQQLEYEHFEKQKALAEKANVEKIMETFATENGFKFEKSWHNSYRFGRSGRHSGDGYYTFSMSKGCITASISYDNSTQKVRINSYTVVKKDIQIDELNSIIEANKNAKEE